LSGKVSSMLFSQEIIANAQSLIERAKEILIVTHKSPDGDAIGSSLAMKHYLFAKGKSAKVMVPDLFPSFLDWMSGASEIVVFEKNENLGRALVDEADLIFILDFNTPSRAGKLGELLPSKKANHILIDHHRGPDSFPDVLISDISVCSTAQLIFEFIEASADLSCLDLAAAECLYCGIMTDSGSFRFPSVTSKTHKIAAHLIDLGLDHARVHRMVYDTNLPDRLKLIGFALSERLEVLTPFRTAIISLTHEELTRFNHRPGDTESLVNQALSVEGVRFAAFFREGNNEVRCSFRSVGDFDCNAFARAHFNGGGHLNAAGGTGSLPVADVIAKFKALLPLFEKELYG